MKRYLALKEHVFQNVRIYGLCNTSFLLDEESISDSYPPISYLFQDQVHSLRELCFGVLSNSCHCSPEEFCSQLNLPQHVQDQICYGITAVTDQYFESYVEPSIDYTYPNEY